MLYDAHVHLQMEPLLGLEGGLKSVYKTERFGKAVVNGTHPDDWNLVKSLADKFPSKVIPAYGVHPWRVAELEDDNWCDKLRSYLNSPDTFIGEIGLDQWIEPRNQKLQEAVFLKQWNLAAELNKVPTVHCLKAERWLLDCLNKLPTLSTPWLVHGFGGSWEIVQQLLDRGAYFSFSAYALPESRKRMKYNLLNVPMDRLLVETDAPSMAPPPEYTLVELEQNETGERLNHPANLNLAYEEISVLRGMSLDRFQQQVERNFQSLFR